jgi:hypothetical protein
MDNWANQDASDIAIKSDAATANDTTSTLKNDVTDMFEYDIGGSDDSDDDDSYESFLNPPKYTYTFTIADIPSEEMHLRQSKRICDKWLRYVDYYQSSHGFDVPIDWDSCPVCLRASRCWVKMSGCDHKFCVLCAINLAKKRNYNCPLCKRFSYLEELPKFQRRPINGWYEYAHLYPGQVDDPSETYIPSITSPPNDVRIRFFQLQGHQAKYLSDIYLDG